MSEQAARSQTIRARLIAARDLARERYPNRYDWARAGRGDLSAEVIEADRAEAELEDAIAAFVSRGGEFSPVGAAFNAWLKALEVSGA